MAGALGGLIDAYVDSDEENVDDLGTSGVEATGRVLLAPELPTVSAAPPVSPGQPLASQPGPSLLVQCVPDVLDSGDILAAMQQQQRQDQQDVAASPAAVGLTETTASAVPLSPGLAAAPEATGSPKSGDAAGEGAAARSPTSAPDYSLPSELPPAPPELCQQQLQDFIASLLNTQRQQGQTLNGAMKAHRDYRNPNFLQKMVEFCDIQQYGSCYPPELWDPAQLPKEDHSDALLQEHAHWQDKRAAERQKRGTVEFAPASTASARAVSAVGGRQLDPRTLTQAAARTSAQLAAQAALQGASKRSKWDHGR